MAVHGTDFLTPRSSTNWSNMLCVDRFLACCTYEAAAWDPSLGDSGVALSFYVVCELDNLLIIWHKDLLLNSDNSSHVYNTSWLWEEQEAGIVW